MSDYRLSRPDYGISPTTPEQIGDIDRAELAARIHNPISKYKTGRVHYWDRLGPNYNQWMTSSLIIRGHDPNIGTIPEGSMVINSNGVRNWEIIRYIAHLPDKILGLEISFQHNKGDEIYFLLERNVGGSIRRAMGVRFLIGVGTTNILFNKPLGWIGPTTAITLPYIKRVTTNVQSWNTLKLTADFYSGPPIYYNFAFGSAVWDISADEVGTMPVVEPSPEPPLTAIRIGYSGTDNTGKLWLNNLVITSGETLRPTSLG